MLPKLEGDDLFGGDVKRECAVFDREFFIKIKLSCPKTVFHGTDIGHAYNTTGKRFLKTVSSDSEEYHFAAENIEQGKNFYEIWKNSPEE